MSGLRWHVEARFAGLVFGVDEVGRGPWAGPVTAAAVCLTAETCPQGLADSKAMTGAARAAIATRLDPARVAIAEASVAEVDQLNIREATFLAMIRAVETLARRLGPPAMVLVDGNALPRWRWPATAIVAGDAAVASIAAAAIAAKVHRDRQMAMLAADHPFYGWETNRGYGTAAHARGLARHGPSAHHRRSFRPVAEFMAG